MRPEFKHSIVTIGTAVIIATLWSATGSVVGQRPTQSPTTYKAPRTADGQPNLNGFWQALNTANWDLEEHGAQPAPYPNLLGAYLAQPPGLSVVEGGTIPYKPEALAKRKQHFESRLKPDVALVMNNLVRADNADPEAKCFGATPPRSTYMPFPFQIIQTKNLIMVAYEYDRTPRMIYLGEGLEKTRATLLEIDSWRGQSVGRWEGDTLVVETRGFDGDLPVWLDRAGNFYSGAANVVERYTPSSPYHLWYEATITDPIVFTRPWKISLPLYRRIEPTMELLEFACIPFAEEFMYGPLIKKK